ncbi:MAG: succinate dehydrogenase, hydrophobic membrane anchor protein [Neisseriaceae bacterium]
MVKRTLTGAHYGVKDWLLQRLTAAIMVVFSSVILVGLFFFPSSYAGWRQFFSYGLVKIISQLLMFCVAYHAWIGVRDIWMDYIKPAGYRLLFHTLTVLWLLGSLIYSAYVLWGLK